MSKPSVYKLSNIAFTSLSLVFVGNLVLLALCLSGTVSFVATDSQTIVVAISAISSLIAFIGLLYMYYIMYLKHNF